MAREKGQYLTEKRAKVGRHPDWCRDWRQFRQLHLFMFTDASGLRRGLDQGARAAADFQKRVDNLTAPRKRRRGRTTRKCAVTNRDVASWPRFVALQQAVANNGRHRPGNQPELRGAPPPPAASPAARRREGGRGRPEAAAGRDKGHGGGGAASGREKESATHQQAGAPGAERMRLGGIVGLGTVERNRAIKARGQPPARIGPRHRTRATDSRPNRSRTQTIIERASKAEETSIDRVKRAVRVRRPHAQLTGPAAGIAQAHRPGRAPRSGPDHRRATNRQRQDALSKARFARQRGRGRDRGGGGQRGEGARDHRPGTERAGRHSATRSRRTAPSPSPSTTKRPGGSRSPRGTGPGWPAPPSASSGPTRPSAPLRFRNIANVSTAAASRLTAAVKITRQFGNLEEGMLAAAAISPAINETWTRSTRRSRGSHHRIGQPANELAEALHEMAGVRGARARPDHRRGQGGGGRRDGSGPHHHPDRCHQRLRRRDGRCGGGQQQTLSHRHRGRVQLQRASQVSWATTLDSPPHSTSRSTNYSLPTSS